MLGEYLRTHGLAQCSPLAKLQEDSPSPRGFNGLCPTGLAVLQIAFRLWWVIAGRNDLLDSSYLIDRKAGMFCLLLLLMIVGICRLRLIAVADRRLLHLAELTLHRRQLGIVRSQDYKVSKL